MHGLSITPLDWHDSPPVVAMLGMGLTPRDKLSKASLLQPQFTLGLFLVQAA